MQSLFLSLVFVFAGASKIPQADPRIVNGIPTTGSAFPFIAVLTWKGNGYYDSNFCGGSILRKSYPAVVLTAAHCLYNESIAQSNYLGSGTTFRLNALFGVTSVSADETIYSDWWANSNVTRCNASRIVNYPFYDSDETNRDVSLLVLDCDLSGYDQFEEVSISPLCHKKKCCEAGDNLTVIGYGTNSSGGGFTKTIEYTDLYFIPNNNCNDFYRGLPDNQMCAWKNTTDSCQGDSGGPLVKKGTYEQVGVVSYGEGCAKGQIPGVYAKVGTFYYWIQNMLGLLSNTSDSLTDDYVWEMSVAYARNDSCIELPDPTMSTTYSGDEGTTNGVNYFLFFCLLLSCLKLT